MVNFKKYIWKPNFNSILWFLFLKPTQEEEKMAIENCMEKLNITADKFEHTGPPPPPPDGSDEDGACFTGCILVAKGFVS